MAHFDVPRNLPHAATISRRIEGRMRAAKIAESVEAGELVGLVSELVERLAAFADGDEPPESEAREAAEEAAALGRRIVDEIERLEVGEDRLGQNVRNLFECLGMGEEGAAISLRAGENPGSLLRPV